MDSEDWYGLGLTVRTREGAVLGVVVGVFAEGLLAGRLLVQGEDARGGYRVGPQDGIAVYAIPRSAVVRRCQDSLLLGVPLRRARSTWLMHVAGGEAGGMDTGRGARQRRKRLTVSCSGGSAGSEAAEGT